jgi:macrolide transport system ATP-binding/permease protein
MEFVTSLVPVFPSIFEHPISIPHKPRPPPRTIPLQINPSQRNELALRLPRHACAVLCAEAVMNALLQDLQFALRQLRKSPGFTATVLLTLALGIGANAAIFTLVNSVLLRRLPVANPAALVRIGDNNNCCVNGGVQQNGDITLFATDTYQQLKKSLPEFEELAAMESGFNYQPVVVRREGQPQGRSALGEFVSGNYFRTFGLQPAAGRLLTDSDDVEGAPVAAVMSYESWQHEYAGDSAVIGSTFRVNTQPVTVVGIAPQGFYGDRLTSTPPEFYLPIESKAAVTNAPYVHNPETDWLYLVGRVKPGVNHARLQQKIGGMLGQMLAPRKVFTTDFGKPYLPKTHVVLTPGGGGIQDLQEEYKSNLHLLMWISGAVLLIACANIANLLLVRGMSRRAEMSVRTALGAQRSRIVRQLLTESVLLATLGGLLGLVVAYAGARALLMLAFPDTPNLPIPASPSPLVIGFAFALSLLTGVLFGVAPAWIAAQAQPADALRTGTRTTASGASLLQRSLVILQAAVSLILLVGAGLFVESLNKLQSADLKLDSSNRYMVHFSPQAAGYTTPQVEALYRTIEDRFHALPGMVNVGISNYTPMEDNNWSNGIQIQGKADLLDDDASFIKANAEYFNSVGTRVVMGRGFSIQDTSSAPPVAVVNRTFVKHFFKEGENPIGHRMGRPGPDSDGDFEIVGVVDDTTYTTVRWKDHSMYFIPIAQRFHSDKDPIAKDTSLYAGAIVLETSRPMGDMEKLARSTLSGINPNLTISKFQTFDQQIADRFTDERMIARLMTLFGALALMLASIGLYGVTAYGVVRRTSEIGIRMALGAERLRVIAMVMRGAMIQALIGLVLGIPVAMLCVRFVKAQLYEITSVNPLVMAGAIATLACAATIAGIIPARRAASIDPVKALRVE